MEKVAKADWGYVFKGRWITYNIESNNNEISALNGSSKGYSQSSWLMQGSRPEPRLKQAESGDKNEKTKNWGQESNPVQSRHGKLFAGEEQPELEARGAVT